MSLKPWRIILGCAVLTIVIFALTILFILLNFSYLHWINLKIGPQGWVGAVHRLDAALGYIPVPNSTGMLFLSQGIKIPVHYDSNGFRVASGSLPSQSHPAGIHVDSLLALGCSFTFGYGVPAEYTYCNQLANKLGLNALNAGRCSYGLAEMVTLAREIIPVFRPRIVLVQYSSWLVDRSRLRYAPSYYGLLPHPYFVTGSENQLSIHRPDFPSAIFDLDFEVFRDSNRSLFDFLDFSLSRKLPLTAHDLWHSTLVRAKESLALIPKPAQDPEQIVRLAYGEIESICSRHGSRMVIVVLGMDNILPIIPESLKELDIKIINSQAVLVGRLKSGSTEEYARAYYHRGQNPAVTIDRHPNVHAHKIISESVLSEIFF